MAPIPRYLEEGCCDDRDHVSNREKPDFKKKMEEAVFNARLNIKNFAYRHGLRGCVTLSSWGKIHHVPNFWRGPIDLCEEGYKKLAEAVDEAAT
jgi:hypothetical protein